MSSERTSTGVKIIYSVPASAPRVIFIPVMRLWVLAGILSGLVAWSGVSAWLLFTRYDLTLTGLFPEATDPKEAPGAMIPEADAPRAPAAALVPETETAPPDVEVADASSAAPEDMPVVDVVLPEGQVSPTSGTGFALELLHLKWNGPQAQVSFAMVNVSDKMLSGRIFARAVFQKADGSTYVSTFPPKLEVLGNETEVLDFSSAEGGLFYSTRRRVTKSLALDAEAAETSMTALELFFVEEDGTIQATFRFP
jgi:hypothetical protein